MLIYMANEKIAPPRSIGRHLNFATGRANALCAQILDPHGLSLPQWVILSCLWRHGPLGVSSLAELVGTGVPAASRIVDRMEDRGLVARQRIEADRRSIRVALTETGRALDHLADVHARINAALLAGFSAEDRAAAYDLLQRIEDNARRALD